MIINIPLQIDEKRMEDVIARDYEDKITKALIDEAKKAIASKSAKCYGDKVADGLLVIAQEQVGKIIKEREGDIVAAAAKDLAERLARTKRGKQILEDLA